MRIIQRYQITCEDSEVIIFFWSLLKKKPDFLFPHWVDGGCGIDCCIFWCRGSFVGGGAHRNPFPKISQFSAWSYFRRFSCAYYLSSVKAVFSDAYCKVWCWAVVASDRKRFLTPPLLRRPYRYQSRPISIERLSSHYFLLELNIGARPIF